MLDTSDFSGTTLCCLLHHEKSTAAGSIELTDPVRYMIYLALAMGAIAMRRVDTRMNISVVSRGIEIPFYPSREIESTSTVPGIFTRATTRPRLKIKRPRTREEKEVGKQ